MMTWEGSQLMGTQAIIEKINVSRQGGTRYARSLMIALGVVASFRVGSAQGFDD